MSINENFENSAYGTQPYHVTESGNIRYDKAHAEELIYASPLFTLDRESQSTAYRRESQKMVEYLYCYLMAVNSMEYGMYSCEIFDVAARCIKHFDREGDFLHYFNAAWKQEYSHIMGNAAVEYKFQGMGLTEQECRDYKKYSEYFKKVEKGLSEEEENRTIADLMGLSVERVRMIAQMKNVAIVGQFAKSSEDDEKINLLENAADDFSIEDYFVNISGLAETLDKIETVFCGLQDRQKPIVSDMLTSKIGLGISGIEDPEEKYTFISRDVCEIIRTTGKAPSQRDIADKYGKNEASISRTMKEFLAKLSREI